MGIWGRWGGSGVLSGALTLSLPCGVTSGQPPRLTVGSLLLPVLTQGEDRGGCEVLCALLSACRNAICCSSLGTVEKPGHRKSFPGTVGLGLIWG